MEPATYIPPCKGEGGGSEYCEIYKGGVQLFANSLQGEGGDSEYCENNKRDLCELQTLRLYLDTNST